MMRLRISYSLVAKALAVLVVAAAVLKLQGLGEGPVSASGVFSAPEFQMAIIEFEAILAVWLFSGKYPVGSWLMASVVFVCFAVVSASQGLIGQTSCGCFGRLTVNPWQAFVLDLVVLAALAIGRPDLRPAEGSWYRASDSFIRSCGPWLAGVVLVSAMLIGSAHYSFGSLTGAVAYFRGDRVSISPRLLDVGEGATGEKRSLTVEMTNWTDQPIRVFGGTRDCSCTVLNDLPMTVPPKERRLLSVNFSLSGNSGVFNRTAGFLVDDKGFKEVSFVITGRIFEVSGVAEAAAE
jgi:Protein of unknown function (DUF1573)